MASKKELKKELNNRFGEIIDGALINQEANSKDFKEKTEELVDDIIAEFDQQIEQINKRDVEDRAKHLKSVKASMNKKADEFIKRLNNF
ncbi:M13 family metallopeptidase [Psychroflexus sp. YR1-1]|uniref:M13 family metallopeptidase n=1 Tax=Psychroflexus aurantiacus TaxID=2709310 RepID=A0A6B3QZ53_9FLAO|nr:M13 family metallopeptidase [Psychroflexus aurantiacus]NEV93593.1 M13 family metallopeptidase [Psychroflexus aurantiacus]